MDNQPKIIRLKTALAITGDSRSSAYRKIAIGEWPKPIRIGKRAVGFVESEIYDLNAKRIAATRQHHAR